MKRTNCPELTPLFTSTTVPKQILPILFLFLFISSFGQSDFRQGYYITRDNDTIHGLIDLRSNADNCKFLNFIKDEHSLKQTFLPSTVQSYRFNDGKYYVSKEIQLNGEKKNVFLEFVVNGIADLYAYYDGIELRFFLEDTNGNLLELSNETLDISIEGKGEYQRNSLKYIGILKATFADCMEIQPDIEKAKLNYKSLINLTKEYHNYVCTDEECIIYQKPVPKMQVKIAPVLGVNVSKLSFREKPYSNFKFDPSISPSLGFIIDASFPELNERISVEMGCNINFSKTHSLYEKHIDVYTYAYDANLELTALQPSIALKYTFPTGSIRPFAAVGVNSNILVSKNQKTTMRESNINEILGSEYNDYFPLVTGYHGLLLELGSNIALSSGLIFFTNIKMSILGNYTYNYVYTKGNFITANLNLGVYLNTKNK